MTVAETKADPSTTPIIWRTIIEVRLSPTRLRRSHTNLSDAAADVEARLRRIDCARQVLDEIEQQNGDDWTITCDSRTFRAERRGGAFADIEDTLVRRGLSRSDFTVRVEYSRAWGML